MKNKKGQSLIEIVFSICIVILVLTGVAVLTVSTNKAKTLSSEREKAIELSQLLIENKLSDIKINGSNFWSGIGRENKMNQSYQGFDGYSYDVQYGDSGRICNDKNCVVIFTVKWGDNQSLSVERLFSKIGT